MDEKKPEAVQELADDQLEGVAGGWTIGGIDFDRMYMKGEITHQWCTACNASSDCECTRATEKWRRGLGKGMISTVWQCKTCGHSFSTTKELGPLRY